MMNNEDRQFRCASGKHTWLDDADRERCCNGYARVQSTAFQDLAEIGAENIVFRGGLFRGWQKEQMKP